MSRNTIKVLLSALLLSIIFFSITTGCENSDTKTSAETIPKAIQYVPLQTENTTEREEWFKDQAFGMFIHWSVDSQLGSVIGHSMVGASDEYIDRFIEELPKTYKPKHFDPDDWARLARLAGMRYMMFTTKHFSGFCNFETATTDFGIMNTPYGKDITAQVVDAFRAHDIAIGFYFAPEDNKLLHDQGYQVSRRRPEANLLSNPELRELGKRQMHELLTNYGDIDLLFIDGEADTLKHLAWAMHPEIVVTRGAMETPEQRLPTDPMPGPWEACYTMGTQWQFKPTNEDYKDGTRLIEMLIETRAKGGNLLLNVGPTPDGEIPHEQSRLLREVGLWMFVNGESIYETRPREIIREGNLWFTESKDGDTVYIFFTGEQWEWGTWKDITVTTVRASDNADISILGQSDEVLEYQTDVTPKTTWTQDENGLHIRAMRAQRLYNDRKWPNPVVIRVRGVE